MSSRRHLDSTKYDEFISDAARRLAVREIREHFEDHGVNLESLPAGDREELIADAATDILDFRGDAAQAEGNDMASEAEQYDDAMRDAPVWF